MNRGGNYCQVPQSGVIGRLEPDSQFLQHDNAESFQLINPYITNPDGHFGYFFDDDAREVEIFIHPNSSSPELVQTTIDILGLNRNDLLEDRYRTLYSYRIFRQTYDRSKEIGDDMLIQLSLQSLSTSLGKHAQYSGMCNFFQESINLGDEYIYIPKDDDYLEEVSIDP